MVIHKPAVIQYTKHTAPKIIEPSVNPDSDGYIFGYRMVGIADIYANKTAGVYAHHKAVADEQDDRVYPAEADARAAGEACRAESRPQKSGCRTREGP